MEFIELKANIRDAAGKGVARKLRAEGKLPAVLYGKNTEAVMLSVNAQDLQLAVKKSTTNDLFVDVEVEGLDTAKRKAMVKEIQVDPTTGDFIHVDFMEISMDQKIQVMVPVEPVGLSKGVDLGGLLQVIRRELAVICKPQDVPEKIEIDVTELAIGDAIHVDEVKLEGDMEIPFKVNFTVITVIGPKGMTKAEALALGEGGEEEAAEEE